MLAKQHHPDKHMTNKEAHTRMFIDINNAYKTLLE